MSFCKYTSIHLDYDCNCPLVAETVGNRRLDRAF
jgi:hypothetical protein